ncbi:Fanconi anemia core complex-associated protein 24-like isoform X2 [Liolophura sinensis]
MYEEDLGVVDFHPSMSVGVIYLSEADIITGTAYKRKLVKFRKANRCKGVILAERTAMSSQYYSALQRFVVLELGFVLIPVANQTEAGTFLVQMVNVETKPEGNPFKKKKTGHHTDLALLESLQCIPKLGVVKVKALLVNFHSIEEICNASTDELAKVIGRAGAAHLKDFLTHR